MVEFLFNPLYLILAMIILTAIVYVVFEKTTWFRSKSNTKKNEAVSKRKNKKEHSKLAKIAMTGFFISGIAVIILNSLMFLSEELQYVGLGLMGVAVFIWNPELAFWIFWIMLRSGGSSGRNGGFGGGSSGGGGASGGW